MNLNRRPSIDPRWVDAVQLPLDGFVNCTIELLDMHMDEDGGIDYNWQTNTGGSAEPTVLFTADAQMQVYRFTLTMDAPVGSVDQVRSVRFTMDQAITEGVDIRKGQQVRVVSCPGNTSMERYQYVVNSAINSGTPFRRTIETEVDLARVVEQ